MTGGPDDPRGFVFALDQPGRLIQAAQDVLHRVGTVMVPASQDRDELAPLFARADAVLSWGNTRIGEELLSVAGRLKVISVMGTGYDNVDLEQARKRGIRVTNTPGVNAWAVAEFTLAVILMMLRKLYPAVDFMRRGEWILAERLTGQELRTKVVGVVGLGNIGRRVAGLLRGFGAQVVGHDPYVKSFCGELEHVRLLPLDELCRVSDIVTIHVPLTEETRGLLGGEMLGLLKEGCFVVNTARAGVVDEDSLVPLLKRGAVAGYAVDVFPCEPPDLSRELYRLENVLVTPHIAAMTDAALAAMQVGAAQNAVAVLQGSAPSSYVC